MDTEKQELSVEQKRDKWLKDDFADLVVGIAPAPSNAVEPKRMSANPAMYREGTSFKPGQSGNPAGTRKGAQMKKTVRQIVEEMRFSPIEAAVMIITEDKRIKKKFKIVDPVRTQDKIKLMQWLGDKIYPSLKAVEVTNIDGDLAEAGRPKTVQLYLPEKGSTDAYSKKKPQRTVTEIDRTDEPVRLELTVENINSMVVAGDGETSDGLPQEVNPVMDNSSDAE